MSTGQKRKRVSKADLEAKLAECEKQRQEATGFVVNLKAEADKKVEPDAFKLLQQAYEAERAANVCLQHAVKTPDTGEREAAIERAQSLRDLSTEVASYPDLPLTMSDISAREKTYSEANTADIKEFAEHYKRINEDKREEMKWPSRMQIHSLEEYREVEKRLDEAVKKALEEGEGLEGWQNAVRTVFAARLAWQLPPRK